MISWSGLVGNVLWICGLAVCLAALSMARFQARAGGEHLLDRLREPRSGMAIAAGLILFCAGLLLCSNTWWEMGIWGACVAWSSVWLTRQWGRLGAERGEGA